jgi:hypothetical protein
MRLPNIFVTLICFFTLMHYSVIMEKNTNNTRKLFGTSIGGLCFHSETHGCHVWFEPPVLKEGSPKQYDFVDSELNLTETDKLVEVPDTTV